jgi:hypothetical protein
MESGIELVCQSCVHRPVFRHPGESRQGIGADMDGIMCLSARRCACMPMVKMRLIDYL